MKILSKATIKVPIGYINHNGVETIVCYATSRNDAKDACLLVNNPERGKKTNKQKAEFVKSYLKFWGIMEVKKRLSL